VALPLLTVILTSVRSSLSLSTEFLAYLVLVLVLTTWGGAIVGVVAALAAFAPRELLLCSTAAHFCGLEADDVVSLLGFSRVAVGASIVVSRFARRSREADRARAEAQVLVKVVATVGTSHEDLMPLLDSLRAVFDASSAAILVRVDGRVATPRRQWRRTAR